MYTNEMRMRGKKKKCLRLRTLYGPQMLRRFTRHKKSLGARERKRGGRRGLLMELRKAKHAHVYIYIYINICMYIKETDAVKSK